MTTDKLSDTPIIQSRWDIYSREEVATWPHFHFPIRHRSQKNAAICEWQTVNQHKRWVYVNARNCFAIDDPVLATDFVLRFG